MSKLDSIFPATIGIKGHIRKIPEWVDSLPKQEVNPLLTKYKDWLS